METFRDASAAPDRDSPVPAPRWLNPEEQRAWRLWLALSGLLYSQVGSDLLADTGLSSADYQVLVRLSEAPDRRLRMTELALLNDWSKSRLSHQFARMEARGLVTRQECPSDGRGMFAALTDKGMDEIIRAAPAHVESVRRHFIDLLDPEELRQLNSICSKILEHLRTQPVGSRLPSPEACLDGAEAGCGSAAESLTDRRDHADHPDRGAEG